MTRPLRVGVIGANLKGSWGARAHLPALKALEQLQPIAVATAHRSTAEATAKHFGIPLAFDDPRALVEHPDVDIVSVCVRLSSHRELVHLALDAGKHVWCEWPLAPTTAEAIELRDAAKKRGVVHAIGLQARAAPALAFVRDLIAEGKIGRVCAAAFTHSRDWFSNAPPGMEYLQDRSSGAYFLSIIGGHAIDPLCWLLGEFTTLFASLKTCIPQVPVIGTGERIVRTSPDQVAVIGELPNGAIATIRLSGTSQLGLGIRLEINGDAGDLVVSAVRGKSFQTSDLRVQCSAGSDELQELAIPERYFRTPAAIRSCPPLNVGEAYIRLAEKIRGTKSEVPDFDDAIVRHRMLDRIVESAREGKAVRS